jgi:hypothetical protein
MLEVQNRTDLETGLAPAMDRDGRDHAVIVIKGTFDLATGEEIPPLATEQLPVVYADEHAGEPGESSVLYEMDTCLRKPGTDVILSGTARPPRPARRMDVSLQAGPIKKVVRVIGDRRWSRQLGVWKAGDPEPFEEMPLVWERSFGGRDETHDNPKKHGFEDRNPVGTGFAANRCADRLEGLALPNLENPAAPIGGWKDRPAPAGFGFTARHWQPRAKFGGTYDARWEKKRAPFLPKDFNERFFCGAAAGQTSGRYFRGGEVVRIVNLRPEGEWRFQLPTRDLAVQVWIKGEARDPVVPVLDTVVIDADAQRLIQVWRATIPCPRLFLYIDCVRVTGEGGKDPWLYATLP